MKRGDARRLLDGIGVLRHRSDLDLLVFFARHPRSLLASESLAAFLGYDLKEIAESLDVLLSAGLIARRQTPAHAARMYVFAADGPGGGWLPELLRLARTREGRLALREALMDRSPDGSGPAAGSQGRTRAARPGPRELIVPKPNRMGSEQGASSRGRREP
jgi:hypothetical protein